LYYKVIRRSRFFSTNEAEWTFRQKQALLTFRRSASGGPATELRFDRGGGHFILKRQ
jgi:hypothetical protein